jgi:2-methylcitrate dehydratase PrpD
MIDGKIDADTFTRENIHRPDVRELMTKVDWVVDEEFERRYPEHYSCAVTVTMEDGTEYTSVIDDPKGDYRNPVTQEQLEDKFRALAGRELDAGRVERIVALLKSIHEVEDISELFSLTG